ncbi:MAG: tetratricopeptide repeat protein [Bernardetiaceae bacterium]
MSYKWLIFLVFLFWGCQDNYDLPLSEARTAMQEEDYAKALPLIEQVLAQTDQNDVAYNLRGSLYFAEGRHAEALEDFSAAIALNPKEYKYLLNRGHAHHALNDLTKALDDYSAALDLNGNEADIYLNRGIVLLKTQQDKMALADLNRSINLNKSNAAAFYYRALIHRQSDNLSAARDDLQRALVLDSNHGKAHFELALIDLTTAPSDPPETLCLHLNRAEALGETRAAPYIAQWCKDR